MNMKIDIGPYKIKIKIQHFIILVLFIIVLIWFFLISKVNSCETTYNIDETRAHKIQYRARFDSLYDSRLFSDLFLSFSSKKYACPAIGTDMFYLQPCTEFNGEVLVIQHQYAKKFVSNSTIAIFLTNKKIADEINSFLNRSTVDNSINRISINNQSFQLSKLSEASFSISTLRAIFETNPIRVDIDKLCEK